MASISGMVFPASLPLSRTRIWSGHHHGQVLTMGFSTDGNLLATGGRDGVICVFHVGNDGNEPIACLYLDASVAATVLHWIGPETFWLGASDGSVTCWSLKIEPRGVMVSVIALCTMFPLTRGFGIDDAVGRSTIIFPRATPCLARIWER